MKYWLLTTEYPPFYGGGISTYSYHTACMLTEKGFNVTVFVADGFVKNIKIEKFKEARIIRFNPSQTKVYSFLGYHTSLSYEYANILKTFIEKEGKPDVIESQDYNGIAYFLLQFKHCLYEWCKNIPVIITTHSPSFLYMEYNQVPIYKKPNYWIGEMEKFCLQAADLLISPSHYLIKELKERMNLINEIHVVQNPYRFNFQKSVIKNNIVNDTIVFYGKLSAQKGTFKLLEKFKTLWDKGFNNKLLLIGDQNIVFHPLAKTMGDIVKKDYNSYIKKGLLILKNKIAPDKLEHELSSYSFFIVPSIVDNLPYVVLELMAQGKIVLASTSGGQAEVISNNSDGFLFDYTIANSLEQSINKMKSLAGEELDIISKKAVQKIKSDYSYEKIFEQKNKLLNKTIEQNKIKNDFPFIRNHQKVNISNAGEKGLLSIVIPYYNLGKYIDEAIDSILKSTYKNIEILIINDGSTNKQSIEKLDKYTNHNFVKVYTTKNSGLANTRNHGASIAKGEYLAFLDADDMVYADYYQKAIDILEKYKNVFFVGCWTQYFENSKSIWPTFNPEPPLFLTHNTINSSALVYKKDAYLKYGKNDSTFKLGLEDYDSVISMIFNGACGVAIPEILFKYRVRKKSMIKGVTKNIRKEYYKLIKNKHIDLFIKYNIEIENLLLNNAPALTTDNSTLDELPFSRIPLANKITKKLVDKAKSNIGLKKALLQIRNLSLKK